MAYLRPTSLQQLRAFLEESGAALAPWSSADEVTARLASLLKSRRDDQAFFARLTPFLEELRASAARGEAGLPAPDAEVLSRATVESIVEELRERLSGAPADATPSLLRALFAERAAPIMCLALLATACTEPHRHGEEVTWEQPAKAQGNARVSPGADAGLASTDAMVEMFKTRSPEEAAAILEKAIAPDAGRANVVYEEKKPGPLDRTFPPKPVPLYRGVQF